MNRRARWITVKLSRVSLLQKKIKKLIFTLEHTVKGQKENRGFISALSLASALDGGEWSTLRPGRFDPGKETRYPLYRKVGGPQGRSELAQNISETPGYDPRTAHPLGSRHSGPQENKI